MFQDSRFLLKYNFPKITLFLSCLLLVIIFLLNPHYIYTISIIDQWFAAKGLIFYKEFGEFHFPLGYLLFIPMQLATNWNLELQPFLGLFFGIATLTILYKTGLKILTPIGNTVSLLFFSMFYWYAATGIIYYEEILMGFLLSGLLFFILNLDLKSSKIFLNKRTLFFIGTIFALTEFTGQITTLTLIIFFLYLTYLIYRFKKPFPEFLSTYLSLVSGIATITTIISLYFILNNAFQDFFYYNITYYFQYAGYEKNILMIPKEQIAYFYSPMIIMILISTIKLFTKKQITPIQNLLIVSGLATIPFIIFSVYHPHHYSYALPILAIAAGFCVNFREKSILLKIISCIMILIPSYIIVTTIIPWHISRITFPPSMKIYNDVYPQDRNSINDTISWLKINVPSSNKILVLGNPIVYIKSSLLPSSRPSKGMPHSWGNISQIKAEIFSSPPNYWIVDQQFVTRLRTNYSDFDIMPFVDNEMLHCYTLEKSFDKWQIWKREPSCKIII